MYFTSDTCAGAKMTERIELVLERKLPSSESATSYFNGTLKGTLPSPNTKYWMFSQFLITCVTGRQCPLSSTVEIC